MILILIEIFFSNDFDNTADELYYTYTMIYEHGLRVRTKQSVHARHTNFFKRYEVTKWNILVEYC